MCCPECREARRPGRYLLVNTRGYRHLFNTAEEAEYVGYSVMGVEYCRCELYIGEVPIRISMEFLCQARENARDSNISDWESILIQAEKEYQMILAERREHGLNLEVGFFKVYETSD